MIFTRSPLRITLGGGGTDLPSYYLKHEGFLIAAAIDHYVYVNVMRPFSPGIYLKYSELEKVDQVNEVQHQIIREALNLINYSTTTADGYGFQIEMSIRCVSKRLNIYEFPIIFEERREGESKMTSRIIFEAMLLILKLFPKRYLGMKIC